MRSAARDEIRDALAREFDRLPVPSADVFARTMAVYQAESRLRAPDAPGAGLGGLLARGTTALLLAVLPPVAAETLASNLDLRKGPPGDRGLVPGSVLKVAHLFGLA